MGISYLSGSSESSLLFYVHGSAAPSINVEKSADFVAKTFCIFVNKLLKSFLKRFFYHFELSKNFSDLDFIFIEESDKPTIGAI